MQRDCTIVPCQLCRRDPVLHTKAFHVVIFCCCYCLILAEGQTRLSDFTFTFHFRALEKEMAAQSSVLAWRINPRDGGAWWAAVYGVAQSRTRLKRHSSSSSNILQNLQNPNQDIHMDPIKMQSTFVKMRIPHVTLL